MPSASLGQWDYCDDGNYQTSPRKIGIRWFQNQTQQPENKYRKEIRPLRISAIDLILAIGVADGTDV